MYLRITKSCLVGTESKTNKHFQRQLICNWRQRLFVYAIHKQPAEAACSLTILKIMIVWEDSLAYV